MNGASAPDAAASSTAPSKRARILRRTAVGTLLAAAVTALLFLSGRSESGAIVIVFGLALSALACLEFQRMGAFAGAGYGAVLLPCWLVVCALGYHTLEFARLLRSSDVMVRVSAHGYSPDLLFEVYLVALHAVIARAVVAGWRSGRPRVAALVLALWALAVSVVFLDSSEKFNLCLDRSDGGPLVWVIALLPAAIAGWIAVLAWDGARRRSLLLVLWVAPLLILPLPWLWHVWNDFGQRGLIALVLLAKLGDIAGYYVGSAIGVRHPFPGISPGKTVAGCVGSLVAGTVAGGALVAAGLLPHGPWGLWGGFAAGAATNLAAQSGDLLESWIKRRAGVKDSGTWFGPAGGVLDLVDSLLLAVPAALVVWPLVLA